MVEVPLPVGFHVVVQLFPQFSGFFRFGSQVGEPQAVGEAIPPGEVPGGVLATLIRLVEVLVEGVEVLQQEDDGGMVAGLFEPLANQFPGMGQVLGIFEIPAHVVD
jgi:hypothetical protein